MRVAILFDADADKYDGSYGIPIRNTIFRCGVLQASGRHMRIMSGDLLVYGAGRSARRYEELAKILFFSHPFELLHIDRLEAAYGSRSIYAWVVENIDETTAHLLHECLSSDTAYIGMHGVNLANPVHSALYRASLGALYRIQGRSCNAFFSMGDEEDQDRVMLECLHEMGFDVLEWEDNGARGTIFDDFDTPDHFSRVEAFASLAAQNLAGGRDDADELVLALEDLSPALLGTLGACARTLSAATHPEEVAQAGVSARRYLEQLADAVFPAQSQPFNGREVTQGNFRNRLWAHIERSLSSTPPSSAGLLMEYGKEVDRVLAELNAAIHGKVDRDRLMRTFTDMAILSITLLRLDPIAVQKPYYAFAEAIRRFVIEGRNDR